MTDSGQKYDHHYDQPSSAVTEKREGVQLCMSQACSGSHCTALSNFVHVPIQ